MRFLGIKFIGPVENLPHSFAIAMEFVVFLKLFPLSLMRKVDNFIGGHPDVGIQFLNIKTRQGNDLNFLT
jgi:threonine/homoserine efflux transporter RhtA